MTLSRESELLVEAALKSRNWFWKTTHREAFVTKVKVPLIELQLKDRVKRLKGEEKEEFLIALRKRALEAEPEARELLQTALRRIAGAPHQKVAGALIHREARKRVEEEAREIIRRLEENVAQQLFEKNFSDFVKLLPELHARERSAIPHFINTLGHRGSHLDSWKEWETALRVRFNGDDVGGDSRYESLAYNNLYLILNRGFSVEEHIRALRAINSWNIDDGYRNEGVLLATKSSRNFREFILSLGIIKRWSSRGHQFWGEQYKVLRALCYGGIISKPYQLEAALSACKKYGVTYLVQKCAEHDVIKNHTDLEDLLHLCQQKDRFMRFDRGMDAIYAEIESLRIESVKDIRDAIEKLEIFAQRTADIDLGDKERARNLLERMISSNLIGVERAVEDLNQLTVEESVYLTEHYWVARIADLRRYRSLRALIKIIRDTMEDPRYTSVVGLTEMGFIVCHVANAFTNPKKVRSNILGFFDEGNKHWNPSCSIIKTGYLASLANPDAARDLGGPVGVIFSEGTIYEAHLHDVWTKDKQDENGNTYRTGPRAAEPGIVAEFTNHGNHNEVLLREWKVGALFFTRRCKKEALTLLKGIREELPRKVPIYEIDLKTKHWRIIEEGQE